MYLITYFFIGEDWKLIKLCVHGIQLLCHLHLMIQMSQAKTSFPQLTVSVYFCMLITKLQCVFSVIIMSASCLLYKSIADSLQLDHDARKNLDSVIVPCCGELRELKGGHYHKITEITENAGKTLLNDYTVSFVIHPIYVF